MAQSCDISSRCVDVIVSTLNRHYDYYWSSVPTLLIKLSLLLTLRGRCTLMKKTAHAAVSQCSKLILVYSMCATSMKRDDGTFHCIAEFN